MGIPLKDIKEKCCDSSLETFEIINGDNLDKDNPTCDKIVECSNKYILVEEKSIVLKFFDSCCKELGKNLEDYRYNEDDLEKLDIEDLFGLVKSIDNNLKERLLSQSITALLSSSLSKVSNTTYILTSKYNEKKASNMPIFYLFCKTNTPIDRLISTALSRYKKQIFIECNDLKDYLNKKGCNK